MPQQHILKIAEIFPSIQGEGLRQGEATLFIRLAGCNLECSFCDTKYAWKEGRADEPAYAAAIEKGLAAVTTAVSTTGASSVDSGSFAAKQDRGCEQTKCVRHMRGLMG